MYKVFIKDKRIVFTNNQQSVDKLMGYLQFSFFSTDMVPTVLSLLENNEKLKEVVFCIDNMEEAFEAFKTEFKLIEAAGGVVKNSKNETLFIYRLDKWDLPKGKIEKGEKIEEAAIREVEEECAVDGLMIKKQLHDCYHIYHLKDKPILKRTYWFEMFTNFEGKLIPQQEEGIEKVEWLTDKQIKDVALKNTYASIADFLSCL